MSPQPVKIAYFIDRLIFGGTELQLVQQINKLEGPSAKQLLFCLYESEDHKEISLSCPVEILNIRRLRSPSNVMKLKKVVRLLRERKVQIVQTYFFDSTLVGVLCGRLARVNTVISCRRDMGFWYTPALLFWLKIINKFTDRILVNSKAVMKNVVEKEGVNPSKIDVISNGIETKDFEFTCEQRTLARSDLGLRTGEILVGIIANMSRRVKRVDLFIQAAKILVDNGVNAKFAILGDGVLKPELIAMANDNGIKERVVFLDRHFDKKKLLAAMDIGVICSDSEGLSNSILEYMASGILVVASDIAGNAELIKDGSTGYLFRKGDPRALASCIKKCCKMLKKENALSQLIRGSVRKYDWALTRKGLLDYYTSHA